MTGSVLLVVLVAVAAFGLPYHRQITSWLTHWKRGPAHTEPYRAFGSEPLVHVGVVGDIGDGGAGLEQTASAMACIGRDDPFDALLLLGDNVYPAGDPTRLADTVFEPFRTVLAQGTELLAVVGNHDVKLGHGDEQMHALGMPGRWWSHRIGEVLFVGLDSNHPRDAAQQEFLGNELRNTTARWKIVALHHPPYSAGYQGSSKRARAVFSPIFEEYGVQLVLSGHDHDYQRSEPIAGVTYVVSGAATRARRTGEASFTARSFAWRHFVDIAVFDDRLVLRAVNEARRVGDEVVLRT